MSSNGNEVGPGAKAILGVITVAGGGVLLRGLVEGSFYFWFLFTLLVAWTVATFTRIWSPWVAVISAGVVFLLIGFVDWLW
jgi:hypothetical protein